MPPAHPFDSAGDFHASANETALYGAQLQDVRFLGRRGYGVHMEGPLFRVGNRLMSRRRLVALAERERSLLGRI